MSTSLMSLPWHTLDSNGQWCISISSTDSYNYPDLPFVRRWLIDNNMILAELGTLVPKGAYYFMAYPSGWMLHRNPADWTIKAGHPFVAFPLSLEEVRPKPKKEDEHTRMCRFFFGRPPTDQSKLPPPPKELGRSWDWWLDD